MSNYSGKEFLWREARSPVEIEQSKAVILWGAGSYMLAVSRFLGSEKVLAVIDNDSNKWGKVIDGFCVQSPACLQDLPHDAPVVISVSRYLDEIVQQIASLLPGEENRIFSIISEWSAQYRYLPDLLQKHKSELNAVLDILEDEESKRYYSSYINTCLSMQPIYLRSNPKISVPYVYDGSTERIAPKAGDHIADCGAYIGDTVELFIKLTGGSCTVYAFEPVAGNFKELCRTAEKYSSIRIIPYQYALGSERGTVQITSETDITLHATIHGEYKARPASVTTEVTVECLDNVLGDSRLDYIKMDIEGEEVNAINGAKELISRERPSMLLSAYHKIWHMWEIPLLVKEICPDYRIYCGHQPHIPLEPEFYCIAR